MHAAVAASRSRAIHSYVLLLLAEMKSSSSTAAYVCGMMVILRMFAPVDFARETFFHAEKTIERVAKLHNQGRIERMNA